MRAMTLVILLGTNIWAQSLVEHAAAAAGGSVGGVAGKKVSDALTGVFEKVDKTTKAAAADRPSAKAANSNEPLFEVGPGVPHARGAAARSESPSVPPPPPVAHRASRRVSTQVAETAPAPLPPPVVVAPPPPPPPQATAADLKKIAVGTDRDDFLKLGFPAIRITMFDDGHLLETFRYVTDSGDVGSVSLSDGTVTSVQVH